MPTNRRASRCQSCQRKTLDLDIYRRPFRFLLPDEEG